MSAHRVLRDIFRAFEANGPGLLADPGDAGTITPTKWGQICKIVSTGVETRTLAAAPKEGILLTIGFGTDGGDVTLTVTNGENLTLDTAGEAALFMSTNVGGTMYWKRVDSDASFVESAHIADPAASAAMTATLTGVDTGTDMTTAQAATIVADLLALKTAADANNAAIDSILVALEAAGITASA